MTAIVYNFKHLGKNLYFSPSDAQYWSGIFFIPCNCTHVCPLIARGRSSRVSPFSFCFQILSNRVP